MKKNKVGRPSKKDIRNRNIKKYGIVLALILIVSVGFAALTTALNITGTGKVKGNKFDIHFEGGEEVDKKGTGSASFDVQSQEVTYTLTLNEPGDLYSFDFDVVNAGTIDGKIKTITVTGATLNDFEGDDLFITDIYWEDELEDIKVGDPLYVGESKKIVVETYYKRDITAEDLEDYFEDGDKTINCTLQIEYEQGEEKAPDYLYYFSPSENDFTRDFTTLEYNTFIRLVDGSSKNEVCVNRNGVLGCFSASDLEKAKEEMTAFFGADSCGYPYRPDDYVCSDESTYLECDVGYGSNRDQISCTDYDAMATCYSEEPVCGTW